MIEAIDFLIFAPLREERQAVLDVLPGHHQLPPDPKNILIYHRAELPIKLSDGTAGEYSLAVVSPLSMGRVSAATAMAEALQRFTPRHVLLVGIAGGTGARVAVGDVLISDQIVDYELQKLFAGDPEIRYTVFRAEPALLAAVQGRVPGAWYEQMTVSRPGPGSPACHIGPVASGDKVIASNTVLEHHKKAWPKLIGVEMEGGGVASAVTYRPQPPGLLMIRGVSDLADENKNHSATTQWREYACAVAARYALELLRAGPIVFSRPARTGSGEEADPAAASVVQSHQPKQSSIANRPRLRKFLRVVLPDAEQLQAFCVAHFPEVAQSLRPAMDLRSKINLLLMRSESKAILHWIYKDHSDAVEKHENLLFEEAPVESVDTEDYAEKSERLYQAREAALSRGEAIRDIDEQIRALKREQRMHAPQLHEGDVLGERYRLCEEIGRGGFANVWQAWDRKLNMFVASKVLHAQWRPQHPQWQRFNRGARSMARLSAKHPGFVKVLSDDLGIETGFYYFIMEYMPGGDLQKALLGRYGYHLSRAQALAALCSIGEALDFAHGQGLVHRDVKPQNILLDGKGNARLSDFDLVMAEDSTGNTRTGAMGTFIYAAPETLEDAKRVDRRADIYSLGMTFLFVLYGKALPTHIVRNPDPILERLDCSQSLKAVLRRAIAWERAERFPSIAAFLAELTPALLEPQPAQARVPAGTPLSRPAPPAATAALAKRAMPDEPIEPPVSKDSKDSKDSRDAKDLQAHSAPGAALPQPSQAPAAAPPIHQSPSWNLSYGWIALYIVFFVLSAVGAALLTLKLHSIQSK